MDSHPFLSPSSALEALGDNVPGLWQSFEAAQVLTVEALSQMSERARKQCFPDTFRGYLGDQFEAADLADAVTVSTGARNSIVIKVKDLAIIRILKGSRTGRPAAPTSRSRIIEYFRQTVLEVGAVDVAGPLSLTLTWRLTAEGIALTLALPMAGKTTRYSANLHWQQDVPYPTIDADGIVEEPVVDDDLDYRRRQDEVGHGDDLA